MRDGDVIRQWPEQLVSAVRAELAGNARRDLLGWAHRTVDAHRLGGNVAKSDVQRARLVLAVGAEKK